jgi:hypothetical protein
VVSAVAGLTAAACRSKRRYASSRDAKNARRSIQRIGGRALEVFRCPWCEGWHVGHRAPGAAAADPKLPAVRSVS